MQNLMSRSEKSPKIYFMSPAIMELFTSDDRGLLQVINAGVKMFNKHTMKELESAFRISQEGLEWFEPFVTKRKVTINEQDFFNLLDNQDPLITSFSEKTQVALMNLEQGAFVFVLGADCKNEGWAGMAASGWRGKVSCKVLIPKEEIKGLKQLGRWN